MIRQSDYYIWLRELTGNRSDYDLLIKQLDTIPFEWVFALDENRAAGGLNLRRTFADLISIEDEDTRKGPCTVLEMLISVADNMTDQLSYDISTWFWQLIDNLRLSQFDDDNYDSRGVEFIINSWLHREYTRDGRGSLFPLKHYGGDCRNLDIWSQMNAWINENYPTENCWAD